MSPKSLHISTHPGQSSSPGGKWRKDGHQQICIMAQERQAAMCMYTTLAARRATTAKQSSTFRNPVSERLSCCAPGPFDLQLCCCVKYNTACPLKYIRVGAMAKRAPVCCRPQVLRQRVVAQLQRLHLVMVLLQNAHAADQLWPHTRAIRLLEPAPLQYGHAIHRTMCLVSNC